MVKTKPIKPKEKRTIVSNKKKDRDQFKKEMDMVLLKQKINEIMKKISNDKTKIENNNIKYKKNIELINEKYSDNSNIIYQSMFQKYMKEQFTLICVSFINKIIIDIKRNHLEQYEGKYNFNKIFISLAKDLFLNEFELILLSLYLEYIDITLYLDKFTMEDSLLFLCFLIKKLSVDNNELEIIQSYLNNKYNKFNQNYEGWYKIIEKQLNNKLYFNYLEINKRFKEYNSPINVYCGNNYIDYNYIVDRILTMSLPYVDVKKENNIINNSNNNINNDSILTELKEKDKTIKKKDIDNEINKNCINNNYINNNYINSDKLNINFDKNYNKQIIYSEPFIDINPKNKLNLNLSPNIKNESLKNSNYNILNNTENNFPKDNINKNKFLMNNPPTAITPNNLLHSLGNINNYIYGPGNNKMLINSNLINNVNNISSKNNIKYPINNFIDINKPNIINSVRPIEEDFGSKKIGSNLIMNAIQAPSQSSFIFNQKPSLMEINLFNRNNSSHIFDEEGEILKQILGNSSENNFRSSMSFENPKYPYYDFVNNGNNNITNIYNNRNTNIIEQKIGDNKRIYNNDIPFKPLNAINNKNIANNIISQNKIRSSDFGKDNTNINNENNKIDFSNIKKDQ